MIRPILSAAVLSAVCWYPAAIAEPIDDARVIAKSTLTEDYFKTSLAQLADMLSGFMQNEFRQNGVELSNDASQLVTGMMMDSMIEGMAQGMWEPMAQAYVDNFSAETLAAYRAFLETEAGREISEGQGMIVAEAGKIGEAVGAQLGLKAVEDIKRKIETEDWPEGTLNSTKKELRKAFE